MLVDYLAACTGANCPVSAAADTVNISDNEAQEPEGRGGERERSHNAHGAENSNIADCDNSLGADRDADLYIPKPGAMDNPQTSETSIQHTEQRQTAHVDSVHGGPNMGGKGVHAAIDACSGGDAGYMGNKQGHPLSERDSGHSRAKDEWLDADGFSAPVSIRPSSSSETATTIASNARRGIPDGHEGIKRPVGSTGERMGALSDNALKTAASSGAKDVGKQARKEEAALQTLRMEFSRAVVAALSPFWKAGKFKTKVSKCS